MDNSQTPVFYWDSSAVLSTLFEDVHSKDARNKLHKTGIHLLSSLTYAEVCAVIARLKRERLLADILISASYESLEKGPWRQLNIHPERRMVKPLASRRSLRGADLWHLCTVLTLREQLPEIKLLTYDTRLKKAASAENV